MKRFDFKISAAVFFVAAIFYMELILRAFTCKLFFTVGLIPVALFSALAGLGLWGICSFFWEKAARGITIGVFSFLFVLFSTQTVYQNFFGKYLIIFSLTAGRADQIVGEGIVKNTLLAILQGLPAIALFSLPMALAIAFFGKKIIIKRQKPLVSSAIVAAALGVNLALIGVISLFPSMSAIQSGMFDPNLAVGNFGLLRTETLDIKYNLLGIEQDTSLENEADPEDIDPTPEEEEQAPVYTPNISDVTFPQGETDEALAMLNEYFSQKEPTYKNEYTGRYEGYNLIYMVAEGFSPYAIHPTLTPTLYKMQQEGFKFNNFYTPIWGVSTSDGEYTACTGLIPKSGVWSFYTSGKNYMPYTLGNMFRGIGVDRVFAYHNHTHSYYHRDISHPNMGYNYKGMGSGVEKYVKKVWPESDLEMITGSLPEYLSSTEPFHAYYMTVSGHLNYTRIGNSMVAKNWNLVKDLDCSEQVKGCLACNIELDRAVEKLLAELNAAGVADKTVIAITPDHYPYGLEADGGDTYAVWRELLGHEVETTFELYKSCFLLYCQGDESAPVVDKYCYAADILPTLLNLFGFEYDSRLLTGSDILSTSEGLVIFSDRSFITDYGKYDAGIGEFTPHDPTCFPSEEKEQEYVASMKAAVNNRFKTSAKILEKDYYGYLFGTGTSN